MPVQQFHLGVYALFENDAGKYLVLKTDPEDLDGEPVHWTLPGGRLEHGEEPRDVLQREIREEVNVPPAVYTIDEVFDMSRSPQVTIQTESGEVGLIAQTFHCTPLEQLDVTLSEEHTRYEWVDSETAAHRLDYNFSQRFRKKL